jgi:HSP20 family protein
MTGAVSFPADEVTRELAALREQMNRLFDETLTFERERCGPGWVPAADVYRVGSSVVVTVELPGVEDHGVEIEANPTGLRVHGRRKAALPRGAGILQLERSYGPFEREFPLPERARVTERRVHFEDGILRIEIPVEPAP